MTPGEPVVILNEGGCWNIYRRPSHQCVQYGLPTEQAAREWAVRNGFTTDHKPDDLFDADLGGEAG